MEPQCAAGIFWTALSLSEMGRPAIAFWIHERFTRLAEGFGPLSRAVVERFREDGAHRVRWAGRPSLIRLPFVLAPFPRKCSHSGPRPRRWVVRDARVGNCRTADSSAVGPARSQPC